LSKKESPACPFINVKGESFSDKIRRERKNDEIRRKYVPLSTEEERNSFQNPKRPST
jgi:hypothetical protein